MRSEGILRNDGSI